jgi:hypothetical protein
MGTGGSFPGGKARPDVTLTTHSHLVPKLQMSRRYTSSPPSASMGVLWDCFAFFYIEAFQLCFVANYSVQYT